MTHKQTDYSRRLRSSIPAIGCLLLLGFGLLIPIGAYGFTTHGYVGLLAAVIAMLVCCLPAIAAIVVTAFTAATPNALSGTLFGMFLRTAIPFFVSILLVQAFKPLADAGLFGMVLISYLVVLAAETVLAVRVVQANSIDGGSAVNG